MALNLACVSSVFLPAIESVPVELPTSIDPCPLVEAVVDVRFEPTVPAEAVFGKIYSRLSQKFPKVTQFPFTILPEAMRKLNPALVYQPQFRLESDNFVVLTGPNIFAVGMRGGYPGWQKIYGEFRETLGLAEESGVIKTIHRFGLHYVNYFDRNILPDLKLNVSIGDKGLVGESTLFKTVLPGDGYKLQLQVATDLKVTPQSAAIKIDPNALGSIIDIDCFQDYPPIGGDFLGAVGDFMESAHTGEKALFFSLLTEKFLSTLNPK